MRKDANNWTNCAPVRPNKNNKHEKTPLKKQYLKDKKGRKSGGNSSEDREDAAQSRAISTRDREVCTKLWQRQQLNPSVELEA